MALPEFPVVGIGASAGGLEAMCALLEATPTLHGMAILIVQHLDPHGESHLVDLLMRRTTLTVVAAVDGREVEPDHVYVCVPNRDLFVNDGRLRLVDPAPERATQRRPIDRFFDSLASAYAERAVAVVLSGTGTDGARGVSSVRSAGGMILVQAPETAEYDGMPRSAISTGRVDLVLPVEKMPEVLVRLAAQPHDHVSADPARGDATDELATLQKILAVLYGRFGYDFANYKRPTLLRRTQRRMSLCNIESVEAYATLIRDDANEAASLFRDLMINVSAFFRDPEAWQEVARDVIDPLLAAHEDGDELRVWSAGCATGEEAYTVGILLAERIEAAGKRIKPQVFATDVSGSLEIARAGVYPETIEAELTQERLDRFFVKRDATYEVKKPLRDMVIFARHNVISDPPFSRMDLVCCRNLLIYIEPETQRRILRLFNFALRDRGVLLLGSAETIGTQTDLFEPISSQWRIYRSRRVVQTGRFDFPTFMPTGLRPDRRAAVGVGRGPEAEYVTLAHRALLDQFTPPSAVIDAAHQVLMYHGDTSLYLSQPGGAPTRDLLALVPPGMRPPLRQAVKEALAGEGRAVTAIGYVTQGGRRRAISLTVSPLRVSDEAARLAIVSFEESVSPVTVGAEHAPAGEGVSGRNAEKLEEELRLTREELRDVSEQYDRLVAEYSTFNEETLSINEELQSANEELETSKEELQSLNEELNTLNNELRSKVAIVEQSNNDLNNLLASTEIATLFLAEDCRIRWFTPAIEQVLRLIDSDVGRPISDLAASVNGSDLEQEARRVLETLVPLETEVDGDSGRVFIRRVLPYRTSDNRIDGVVITFVDITDRKRIEQQRERLMHELNHRVKNTLAIVQAIVQGMGRRGSSLPEFLVAFESRLAALARAQSIMTLPGDEPIGLREILMRECAPYLGEDSNRVMIDGAALAIDRDAAMALELVFHELVTNAAKYGALSNDTGTIQVRWALADSPHGQVARLEWIEAGGARVEEISASGFGSLLIDTSVAHDLAGSVTRTLEPTGFQCVIEFPMRADPR